MDCMFQAWMGSNANEGRASTEDAVVTNLNLKDVMVMAVQMKVQL